MKLLIVAFKLKNNGCSEIKIGKERKTAFLAMWDQLPSKKVDLIVLPGNHYYPSGAGNDFSVFPNLLKKMPEFAGHAFFLERTYAVNIINSLKNNVGKIESQLKNKCLIVTSDKCIEAKNNLPQQFAESGMRAVKREIMQQLNQARRISFKKRNIGYLICGESSIAQAYKSGKGAHFAWNEGKPEWDVDVILNPGHTAFKSYVYHKTAQFIYLSEQYNCTYVHVSNDFTTQTGWASSTILVYNKGETCKTDFAIGESESGNYFCKGGIVET